MAIGTMTAIGLAAAAGGSALAASSQKKAASKAADTSLAASRENNALARDIYGQNKAILSPYAQGGAQAFNHYNALLGLGAPQNAPQAPAQAVSAAPAYQGANALAPMPYARSQAEAIGYSPPIENTMPPATGFGGQTPANAFDVFRNSTGYQFRLGEGLGALNSNAAAGGWLQSGAALKAAQEYGQNIASQEFGNYLGQVGNSAQMGLGAGSALAGVGQNFVGQVSANNQSAADARANAQLIAGQNNPFANALGMAGGYLFGR
jgi:hypothetical protein